MREIFLIAWREYTQYVFSRGFLLLLLLAPIGFLGLAFLLGVMQKSIPERHYVIVDQTGLYAEHIEDNLTTLHARQEIRAWDQFVTINASTSLSEDNQIAPPFAPDEVTFERVRAFQEAGSFPAARAAAAPYLKVDPAAFEPPKRRYIGHNLAVIKKITGDNDVINFIRPYLLDEKKLTDTDAPLFAALIIPEGFNRENKVPAEYWSRNLVDTELKDALSVAMTSALRKQTASEFGVSDKNYESIISTNALLKAFRPDRATEDAALNLRDKIETSLPAIMTYVLFILIFSVGSLLLTNTIEERSNKIVEMLLSSVTANQLMMGKLIGIGAVGLTIPVIGALFALGSAATLFAGNEVAEQVLASVLLSPLVWVYLFYFLCGYVIFAMMYLAIGAISNSLQDAQTFLGPVTLVVMAPLPLMVLVFQDPNGMIASIMTWIPIYTPYAVMLRAASDPPLWEIIGATIFMLVFGAFFVGLMGRIFRRGLLNDSPANLKSLVRLTTGRG